MSDDRARPDPLFVAAAVHRRAVADLLEGLSGPQLATPSLCAGWDVATVGAHLAASMAPDALRTFLGDLVRAGGRLGVANDAAARRAGRRPPGETVALLREHADSTAVPPVTGPRAPLTEVLVHEGDIRVPLGLRHEADGDAVRAALEFVTTGRPVGFVRRGTLRGLRLVATDLDWSAGDGVAVHGRGLDLLMVACGRGALLDRVSGPGHPVLDERLARSR